MSPQMAASTFKIQVPIRVALPAHGLEIPLHPIHSDRSAVNQEERFRVFGKHRRKHTWDNVSKFP